jgi:hypothetical protein
MLFYLYLVVYLKNSIYIPTKKTKAAEIEEGSTAGQDKPIH